jgi:hypothetical protein
VCWADALPDPKETTMTPRRPFVLLAGAALLTGIVGIAAPSHAGPPGDWTVISGAGNSNVVDPSLFRTSDGTLHVAMAGTTSSLDSIEVAHVSASGVFIGRHAAVTSWSGTTSDPDLVGAPGGGMRLVFGGNRTTTTTDPYSAGYDYYASSDAAGASWTLGPNDAPAVKSSQGYASHGTGVISLADGTLVTAFPLNGTISYQVGSGPVQSFAIPNCCSYDMSLAMDGSGAVYAAWYAKGGPAGERGTLVREIYPALGPVMQAPGAVTGSGQAVAMVTRPDGGIYVAYPRGELNDQGFALWRVGTNTARTVPGSQGASHVAMSTGPGGRLWFVWDGPDDNLRVVRTNPAATKFGAVQKVRTPPGSLIFVVEIEGSTGRGDVVFNNGLKIWHQQVLAGLTVKASPRKWKAGRRVAVKFTVTDAGDAIKGAKVKARGLKCTTNKKGVCTLTFPKLKKGKFDALATRKEYAAGSVRLKVT